MNIILVMNAQKSFLSPTGSVYLGERAEILKVRLADFLSSCETEKVFLREKHALSDEFFRTDVTHSVVNTPEFHICDELIKYANTVEDKIRYDALFKTGLKDRLVRSKVKRITMCGLETHTSVLFTSESLCNLGYEVEVIEPCCMSRDVHMHDYALNLMRHALGVRIRG